MKTLEEMVNEIRSFPMYEEYTNIKACIEMCRNNINKLIIDLVTAEFPCIKKYNMKVHVSRPSIRVSYVGSTVFKLDSSCDSANIDEETRTNLINKTLKLTVYGNTTDYDTSFIDAENIIDWSTMLSEFYSELAVFAPKLTSFYTQLIKLWDERDIQIESDSNRKWSAYHSIREDAIKMAASLTFESGEDILHLITKDYYPKRYSSVVTIPSLKCIFIKSRVKLVELQFVSEFFDKPTVVELTKTDFANCIGGMIILTAVTY